MKLLLALSLWAGVTLFWTGAPPSRAFTYWAVLELKLLVVFILLSLARIEQVAVKSLQGYAWGGLILGLVPFVFNAATEQGRLGDEAFLHPNVIGNQMALCSLCSIYLTLQARGRPAERLPYLLLSAMLLFTLMRSLSKTSIIGFFLAALVYIVYSRINIQKKTTLVLLLSGVGAICFTALTRYLDEYLNAQQGGQALATFTGRTRIWQMTWEMIQENPIWGYGFQSYRYTAPQIIAVRLVHPHNELLSIWYTLGAVGLILAVLTYTTYAWQVQRATKARLPQAALGLALLVYSLANGPTTATTADLMNYPSPLMMLMISWMVQRNPISSSKQLSHI
jgi:O-antigen ligase